MAALGGSFGHAHSDVLSAKPTTAEEKTMLVAELKDRGKKAFASGQMPVCDALYSKALEVAPEAAVHANRSAVRLTLGKAAEAVEDAKAAVALDAAYAKGYFRLGAALEKLDDYDGAIAAYGAGQALEPASKVWPNAIAKAQKRKEDFVAKPKETATTTTPAVERYETPARLKADIDAKKAAAPVGKTAAKMRGYKIDSQGRKTTFFNNELDEKTKELIGSIAPKKVDAPVEMKVSDGTSSWNQAGTFESRDHTAWAKEWLSGRLTDLMVDLPARALGGALKVEQYATVKAFKDFKGDCSTAVARGKKKWVMDISFTLDWEFATDDKGGVAKGTAKFLDADCDAIDEAEPINFLLEVDPLTPPEAASLISSHIKSEDKGLRPSVTAIIADLVKEFRATK